MNDKKLMSIGQFSRISGVHIKSLRYYDRIGVLRPAYTNPETGYRFYTVPQLYTLEALQLCLELDIPLKEFSRFLGEDQHLHYDALLDYGKDILRRRLQSIRRSMEIVRASQEELETTERYQGRKGVFTRAFPEMTVALVAISEKKDDIQMMLEVSETYPSFESSGMMLGYLYGYVYDYRPGSVDRYSFIQVLQAPEDVPHSLRVLPAGERPCIWSREGSMIERAPALFPQRFAQHGTVTTVEMELLSKEHDIHHPLTELSIL